MSENAPPVTLYTLERQEPRFITRQQFEKLKKAMPPHMADIAEFTVATGLRMRNVTHLTWDRVDLKSKHVWVDSQSSKSKRPISVPLNTDALTVLKRWRGKHPERVFIFRGKPIDDVNGHAFKAAAASAGLPELRWHDLRHTWASWHIQGGTPTHALRELGGWASDELVQRYAHLSSRHLSKFARNVQRRKRA